MDENELNLNYPLLPDKYIELDIKIKQCIRNTSLNTAMPREIERYTDKYISSVSYEDVMKTVNLELCGPELGKIHGASASKDIEELKIDGGENSEEDAGNQNEESSAESLAGGEDYEHWYNEDEDLVEENNNEEENVF